MQLVRVYICVLSSIISFSNTAKFVAGESLDQAAADDDDDVCRTSACYETAANIRNNMDTSVNPCDDFYSFACGGFINKTRIPDNSNQVDTFDTLRDVTNRQLQYALEEPSLANEPGYLRAVKDYYKSCIDYHNNSKNANKTPSISVLCQSETLYFIPTHILYVRKYFSQAAHHFATRLASRLKIRLQALVQAAAWIDDKTRRKLVEKVSGISLFIGTYNIFWNDTILEETLKGLVFDRRNYSDNYGIGERYKSFDQGKILESLTNNSGIRYYRPGLFPQYDRLRNMIVIPAGYLQGVFFNLSHPWYMDYAAIGGIIDHELSHAVCLHGFDLPPVTQAIFHQKSQCFIDQYNDFTVEKIRKKLDGFYTLQENINDNVGYRIAYSAYRDFSERYEREKSLPGLKYNPKQMFWISAANAWCATYRDDHSKALMNNDQHSLKQFRILGSFQNRPEFAADFKCPLGSRMNPMRKCTLW